MTCILTLCCWGISAGKLRYYDKASNGLTKGVIDLAFCIDVRAPPLCAIALVHRAHMDHIGSIWISVQVHPTTSLSTTTSLSATKAALDAEGVGEGSNKSPMGQIEVVVSQMGVDAKHKRQRGGVRAAAPSQLCN